MRQTHHIYCINALQVAMEKPSKRLESRFTITQPPTFGNKKLFRGGMFAAIYASLSFMWKERYDNTHDYQPKVNFPSLVHLKGEEVTSMVKLTDANTVVVQTVTDDVKKVTVTMSSNEVDPSQTSK
jgi:hypothetical protein